MFPLWNRDVVFIFKRIVCVARQQGLSVCLCASRKAVVVLLATAATRTLYCSPLRRATMAITTATIIQGGKGRPAPGTAGAFDCDSRFSMTLPGGMWLRSRSVTTTPGAKP